MMTTTLNRRPSIMTGQIILYGFIICCILIDMAELVARKNFPGQLAAMACDLLPYSYIAQIFVSAELIDFSFHGCHLGQIAEPLPSIIFLMLKLTLAVTIPILYLAYLLLWPASISEIRENTAQKMAAIGVLKYIKEASVFVLGLVLVVFALLSKICLFQNPSQFPLSIYLPRFIDDIAVAALFLAAATALSQTYFVLFFLLTKKTSP